MTGRAVVVEFRDSASALGPLRTVLGLADAGSVQILDLEFVRSIRGVPSTALASGVDPRLAACDHLNTGLLSQADLDTTVAALTGGSMAAVLVYRGGPVAPDTWAGEVRVVLEGPVADADLDAAPAQGIDLLREAHPRTGDGPT